MISKVPKWPSVVEIEVNGHCNRRCEYCPNSLTDFPGPAAFMDIPLFHRVIGMLRGIDFSGRLSFHFFNEPLLRNDLEELVFFARHALPKAHFVLYTNGDLLNDDRHQKLLDAGIDLFLVTRHDWGPYPQRLFQRVQIPSDFPISGRGGAIASIGAPLRIACHAPSEMLIVTLTGAVVLCHEDAYRKHVMGNLAFQDLHSVWGSDRFSRARALLEAGCRADGPGICSSCDNRLYPVSGAAI